MAPTGRGHWGQRSRGRGKSRGNRGGGHHRSRRVSFKASRTRVSEGPPEVDLDNLDQDRNPHDEDLGDDYSSSSDDEVKNHADPYGALLRMLNTASENQPARKRRKVRHDGHPKADDAIRHLNGPLEKTPEKITGSTTAEAHQDLNEKVDAADGDALDDSEGDDDEGIDVDDQVDSADPFEVNFVSPDENSVSKQLDSVSKNLWISQRQDGNDDWRVNVVFPEGLELPAPVMVRTTKDLKLKEKLAVNSRKIVRKFDTLQQHLAPHLFWYQDILFGGRTPQNARSTRELGSLHVLNHVLKTRDRVVRNNDKLSKDPDIEIRDQGFTRPKVLILLPTRQSCVKYIDTMIDLLRPEQQENKNRFASSYSGPEDQWHDKPIDFQELFSGNDDDMFRLGLKFTRKAVKFFSPFYTSDVILASPLGLRTAMERTSSSTKNGAEGGDHDFLSSIEICLVDQADALLMQNWQHVIHIFAHLNLLPKESHDTDFSRVRSWYLDGHAKHFRQTIIFSAFLNPEINSLSATHLQPVLHGKTKITPPYPGGAIMNLPPLPPTLVFKQTFSRFSSPNPQSDPDTRLNYFITAVLPSLIRSSSSSSSTVLPTLIFIPTHPLFLSLRNHLSTSPTTANISFASISEYTSISDVSRARSHFVRGRHALLLYTERAHHFRRYKIKGVKRIVMVGLPENPLFYGELIEMLGLGMAAMGDRSGKGGGSGHVNGKMASVKVLFSRWDALTLERIVGTERVKGMLKENAGDTFEFV